LHWNEQVAEYEKPDLQSFPPKQKIWMSQNALGDVYKFAYVKQTARASTPLDFDRFLQSLFSECSVYEKNKATSKNQKYYIYTAIDDDYINIVVGNATVF
jgi:hypothetical protein